jgi:hypothetical protein
LEYVEKSPIPHEQQSVFTKEHQEKCILFEDNPNTCGK